MEKDPKNRAVKCILALTVCAAAAMLCVFLYAAAAPAHLTDGAQYIRPSELPTEAKLRELLGAEAPPENENSADDGEKININLADAPTLETLPGIGAQLARRIIEYRTTNGAFASIEDIMLVTGIGRAKFLTLRACICV